MVWIKLNEENINFIRTTNILEERFSCWKLALAITPASNNSQTNVRKGEKICFQAIWDLNFTISLKNLGSALKNLELGRDPPPHVDGPLRKFLKHLTEVNNNPGHLVPVPFLNYNLYLNKQGCSVFFLIYCTTSWPKS